MVEPCTWGMFQSVAWWNTKYWIQDQAYNHAHHLGHVNIYKLTIPETVETWILQVSSLSDSGSTGQGHYKHVIVTKYQVSAGCSGPQRWQDEEYETEDGQSIGTVQRIWSAWARQWWLGYQAGILLKVQTALFDYITFCFLMYYWSWIYETKTKVHWNLP